MILADDHILVAEALSKRMTPHFEVVVSVADGRALLESASSLKSDVIVVDVAMPLMNGLEAGRQLKEKMPGVKLVFLTMNEDPELAPDAMKAGASGYVLANPQLQNCSKPFGRPSGERLTSHRKLLRGCRSPSFTTLTGGSIHDLSLRAREGGPGTQHQDAGGNIPGLVVLPVFSFPCRR